MPNEKNELATYIKEYNQKLINSYSTSAKPIPQLPEEVNYEFIKKDLENIVIGLNKTTLSSVQFDFEYNQASIISAINIEQTNNFVNNLIKQFILVKRKNLYHLQHPI